MIKVAFLNPNIPPRVISLLNKISTDKSIEVKGFFFAVTQKNRYWDINSNENEKPKFAYKVLKSIVLGYGVNDYQNSFISLNLWNELNIFSPDIVVLPGWSDLSSFIAFFWAKNNRKRVILRSESTIYENSFLRQLLNIVTKFICNNVDYIITSSKRAEDYARTKTKKVRVTTIYSSFDTKNFIYQINKRNSIKMKRKYKIKQDKVVYFNGQLIKRKGLLPLLEAFTDKQLSHIALVLTGTGNLQTTVEKFSNEYKNIYSFGYQKQNILPDFYSLSSAFILPSYEDTWGLVTVEALSAGLPVIVSKFAGSSELISINNGFLLNSVDKESIIKAVQYITSLPKNKYLDIRRNNKYLSLKKLSYEVVAHQFVQVFKEVL